MRVVSGKYRGRKLLEFKGYEIRPTGDKAKEALFSILGERVLECKFLDLFAGTGNMGIEALSRGADKVIFVDNAKQSLEIIKNNLKLIKEEQEVVNSNGLDYVKNSREKFDIIFLDPPYAYSEIEKVLQVIKERELLNDGGVIVYEHNSKEVFETQTFEIYDIRKYGYEGFVFLR